ncbi:hypothetical protein NX059_012242 [Plenodomus lindquistii]|nr:hypothetical protein NX059_012242 [Plenodomus lindquistii]
MVGAKRRRLCSVTGPVYESCDSMRDDAIINAECPSCAHVDKSSTACQCTSATDKDAPRPLAAEIGNKHTIDKHTSILKQQGPTGSGWRKDGVKEHGEGGAIEESGSGSQGEQQAEHRDAERECAESTKEAHIGRRGEEEKEGQKFEAEASDNRDVPVLDEAGCSLCFKVREPDNQSRLDEIARGSGIYGNEFADTLRIFRQCVKKQAAHTHKKGCVYLDEISLVRNGRSIYLSDILSISPSPSANEESSWLSDAVLDQLLSHEDARYGMIYCPVVGERFSPEYNLEDKRSLVGALYEKDHWYAWEANIEMDPVIITVYNSLEADATDTFSHGNGLYRLGLKFRNHVWTYLETLGIERTKKVASVSYSPCLQQYNSNDCGYFAICAIVARMQDRDPSIQLLDMDPSTRGDQLRRACNRRLAEILEPDSNEIATLARKLDMDIR